MTKKFHVKKGDTVYVNAGESRGKQGRVLEIIRKKDRAIVEGVNIISKHQKPNAENPQGGILKKEAAVHISNLMIVDPKTGKPTRIGRKKNAEGKLVRYSKKSGEEIK
ncbi:MAG: 50S ribosomal protein L24 [Bacteroidales bacterium]|nr:50S ribosomal protein L24 [Bacteroidales bacterium]